MKKALLALAALLLTATTTNAQIQKWQGENMWAKAPKTTLLTPNKAKKIQKADIADNQRIMGFYTGDELGSKDYAMGLNANGTFKAGVMFTPDLIGNFVGGQIVKARFAVWQDLGDTPFEVYEMDPQGNISSTPSAEGSVSAVSGTWNEVTLDKPVEIKKNYGYILCYTYQQKTKQWPLAVDGDVNPGAEDPNGYGALIYGDLGEGKEAWYLMSTGAGNFMIQAIVEGGSFLPEDIAIKNLSVTKMAQKGQDINYSFSIKNTGDNMPSSYALSLALDGTEVETLNTPITLTNSYQTVNGKLALPSDLTSGQHKLSVTVTSINGKTPTEGTDDDALETSFACYTTSMPRKMDLVENMTSQLCVNCPYGHNVLEALTEIRPNIAWVAVHSSGMDNPTYNQYDIFATDESDNISYVQCNGYPSASFNRMYIDDSSINDQGTLAVGIGYNPQYTQQAAQMFNAMLDELDTEMPSFASVDIATKLDGNNLNIKVSGDAVEDFKQYVGDDAVVTVYLLEDGLVANQTGASKNYVHNHVLRDVVTDNVFGDPINWTSATTYQNEFNVTLDSEWNSDNMQVVAFIGRPVTKNSTIDDVWVNNTNMVKLGASTGIDGATISSDANATEVARYTVDGRKINKPVKGINLVKMSNGKTLKVIVK